MLQRAYQWPPDYIDEIDARLKRLTVLRKDPERARIYYKHHGFKFAEHWCVTYDPRVVSSGRSTRIPFVAFPRQRELFQFLVELIQSGAHGLIEKSRDMGATWICIYISVWLFFFWRGAAVGWGSRKSMLVDRLGDMDTIFEKIRWLVRKVPRELYPPGFDPSNDMATMKIVCEAFESSITGEGGDDIGRGGRKLIYFKDESAHYEHPESIEAALSENTNIQVDISSVHGLGTVFYRKRKAGIEWRPGMKMKKGQLYIFIMDWRDHPEKTQSWYDAKRQKAIDEGLLHVFAQEVDRDYSAAVEGTIIEAAWIKSAIDAHKKLGLEKQFEEGAYVAALDVADGGADRNALAYRKGVLLKHVEEWGERDTGATARRAIAAISDLKPKPIELHYDCIGVGSGVKSEANRLADEDVMPRGINLVPWDAGSGPQNPDSHVGVLRDGSQDDETPLNKDFYGNLKAQGWWELRRRFEKTHAMVTGTAKWPVEDLIALDGGIPKIYSLEQELAQPTRKAPSGRMKLIVDKAPEGSRSPNLADAVMMCFWPALGTGYDASHSWVGV